MTGILVGQADETMGSVLRRLARPAKGAAPASPVSPSRALRLAMIRAADAHAGLVVNVLGITEETLPLDDVLALIEDDQLLLALNGQRGLCGLAGIDLQTRAAVIERQTTGHLRSARADPRPVTATDAAMLAPLIAGFLAEVCLQGGGTDLEGWAAAYQVGGRVLNTRAAGMDMVQTTYRLIRLTLDLGAGERQGQVLIALPVNREMVQTRTPDAAADWAAALTQAVGAAPADLHAVLHRMRLSLRQINALHMGQVLALPGITVASVRLEAADGRVLARVRLGQMAGQRAVRLQPPPVPEMTDATLGRDIAALLR